MDYDNEFDVDNIPKRTDEIYKEIENFKPYELTHCIVYEMAIRNKKIKRKLHKCNRIKKIKEELLKILMTTGHKNAKALRRPEILSYKINYYTDLSNKLTEELINKYLIYPNDYKDEETGLEQSLQSEKRFLTIILSIKQK